MLRLLKKFRKLISLLLTIIALLIVIIVVPMIPDTIGSGLMVSMHTDSAPKLIAHRGLSSLYPENTLPAFYGAAKHGFNAFEFDVHTTKDGQWIVIHDDDVDHMTDSEGEVEDFTLEELREMKLVSGSNIEEYPDIKMPTLRETLDVCKEWNITPVIEIKGCDTEYLPSLKEMLDEYDLSNKAAIISFDEEYLEKYRQLDKDIEILYLANEPSKEDIDWCRCCRDENLSFHPSFRPAQHFPLREDFSVLSRDSPSAHTECPGAVWYLQNRVPHHFHPGTYSA